MHLDASGALVGVEADLDATSFASGSRSWDAADELVTATARIDRFAHGITAGRGLASRYLDILITVNVQH